VLWHVDRYDAPSLGVLKKRLSDYHEHFRPVIQTADIWLYEIVKWPS
jgi:hypothetical protein